MAFLSSFYPQPVVAGTTAGTYAEGSEAAFRLGMNRRLLSMSKQVTLTEAQAKVVQQSLDAAIRAGGANAAVIILPIMQEIETQLAEEASPKPEI
jgi:hypothetical protein